MLERSYGVSYDYVKLLPDADITIKLLDNHWVTIRGRFLDEGNCFYYSSYALFRRLIADEFEQCGHPERHKGYVNPSPIRVRVVRMFVINSRYPMRVTVAKSRNFGN
jgi:hypothetical protein